MRFSFILDSVHAEAVLETLLLEAQCGHAAKQQAEALRAAREDPKDGPVSGLGLGDWGLEFRV